MPYPLSKDFISQTELRKGAEFMIGTSSAVRLLRELYLDALERRIARGAVIEPGPLGFAQSVGIVLERKEAGREMEFTAQPFDNSAVEGRRHPYSRS
jgi:hypothetical protein